LNRIVLRETSGGDFIDREGTVTQRYGSARAAYLIRPNDYIGFRCDQHTVSENLPHYLAKLFSSAASG
jgi:hypothetical protein